MGNRFLCIVAFFFNTNELITKELLGATSSLVVLTCGRAGFLFLHPASRHSSLFSPFNCADSICNFTAEIS